MTRYKSKHAAATAAAEAAAATQPARTHTAQHAQHTAHGTQHSTEPNQNKLLVFCLVLVVCSRLFVCMVAVGVCVCVFVTANDPSALGAERKEANNVILLLLFAKKSQQPRQTENETNGLVRKHLYYA